MADIGTALATSPPVGTLIQRAPETGLAVADLPVIRFYMGKDERVTAEGDDLDAAVVRKLTVGYECVAQAASGATSEQNIDPLYVHVVKSITAKHKAARLGGTAFKVHFQDGAFQAGVYDITTATAWVGSLEVHYISRESDPTATK